MVLDSDKPAGSDPIAEGDDVIRTNSKAIQPAIDLEHVFVDKDAAAQTGRHKFTLSDAVDPFVGDGTEVAGSVCIDDVTETNGSWRWYDGTSWKPMGINDPDIARLPDNNVWPDAQYTEWDTIATAGGVLTVDPAASAFQRVVLAEEAQITVSDALPTDTATTIVLNVNAGVGPYTVTWAAEFRAPGGIVQYAESTNADTLFYLTRQPSGLWVVTSLPNWNVSGVTTVSSV